MIYIVTGLARTGKAMFMQMLQAGGIELTWDEDYLKANQFNEKGFFEYKNPGNELCDPDFRKSIDGKAINAVAHQMMFIPFASRKDMKVVWVQRSFDKVLASLTRTYKKLRRLSRCKKRTKDEWKQTIADLEGQIKMLERELKTFHSHIVVNYDDTLKNPRPTAERLAAFVERPFDIDATIAVPESRLCHN